MFDRRFDSEQSQDSVFVEGRRLPFVILLSLALVFMMLDRAEADVLDDAREAITDFTSPIYEAISPPIKAMRGWFGRVPRLFSTLEENERLRRENAELRAWKEAALLLEKENARYEALLNVAVDPEIGYVTGRVVTEASGPFIRTLVVNLGKRNGVFDGSAVIDEDGLVGRILGSGHNASRVLLLNDLNSHIPVVVEPGNYRAVLSGTNKAYPTIEFLSRDAQVQVGDRVVTSGHGGLLPPHLPVGLVSSIDSKHIRVHPFSNETKVERVRVLQYDFPNRVVDTKEKESDPAGPDADGTNG